MSIINKYLSDLVFLVDYRQNIGKEQIKDIDLTLTGLPRWNNTDNGRGIKTIREGHNGFTYGDSSYDLANGTLIILTKRNEFSSSICEVFANHSVGVNFYFDNNVAGLYGYAPSGFLSSGISVLDNKMHVYTTIYKDGVTNGSNTFVDGIKGNNVTWNKNGAYSHFSVGYGPDSTLASGCTILLVAILNRTDLTNKEISEISTGLLQERGQLQIPRRNFQYTTPLDTDCILHYDMNTITGDNKMADLSGNGNNGIFKDSVVLNHNGIFSKARIFGNGALYLASSSDFFNGNYTIEAWIKPTAGYANTRGLFSTGAANYVGVTTTNALITSHNKANSTQQTTTSVNNLLGVNRIAHVVYTLEVIGNNVTVRQYIDGVNVLETSYDTGFLGLGATAIILGGFSATALLISADISDFKYYKDRVLAQPEIASRYLIGAKKLNFLHKMTDTPPTLVNVTSGKIGLSEFEVVTGTWKISEDSNNKKWVEIVVTGIAEAKSTKAYGTWIWRAVRPTGGTIRVVLLGEKGLSVTPGYYYYDTGLVSFMLEGPGGGSKLDTGSPMVDDIEYEFALTRSSSGVFILYRRVVNGTWASLGTFNDTTVTTSKYFGFNSTAACKHAITHVYEGVLGIDDLPLT